MPSETFYAELKKININLTSEQEQQLALYANYLIEYNEHTNLTAITNLEDIYLKHFYDSLCLTKEVDFTKIKTVIDVGTGAGFPGMVLKIIYPNLKLTLLDANNKKIIFLKNLAEKLGITDINFVNARSEEYALAHLDSFDLVTARAVASLPMLVELCLPLVKPQGYFVAMKAELHDEIIISREIIKRLNGQIVNINEFMLPYDGGKRSLIKIQKQGLTPKGYPRRFDKIKKELKKLQK